MRRFHKPKKKPLPESVEVDIEKFSHDGRGLARIDGRVVLVENAVPGERCSIRIHKGNSKLWQGTAYKWDQNGAVRVEADCSVYEQCGGCQLQHVNHETQLELKQQTIQDHFYRHKIDVAHWAEPIVSSAYQYRHRARLHISGKGILGFHASAENRVVPFVQCSVLTPALQQLVDELKAHAPLGGISQLEISIDDEGSAGLSIIKANPAGRDKLLDWAKQKHWQVDSPLSYFSGNARVYAYPGDFTQVNRTVNQKMLAQAENWLGLNAFDRLLDLFCGNGNLSLVFASQVNAVLGFEMGSNSIEFANQSAVEMNVHAQFHVKDLFEEDIHDNETVQAFAPTVAILDPPRAGALRVCQSLSQLTDLKRLLYISCDPSTLARDLEVLGQRQWRVIKSGLLDMFPQTKHIETMVLLEKGSGKNQ